MKKLDFHILWPALAVAAMIAAAILLRPLLPIDETRYMTVAWEMRLHQGWFAPLTLNFEPYSHKPPLLFWLINLSWSLFGVSRWAALIPVGLSSASVVYLTMRLAKKLTPAAHFDPARVACLLTGSVPFLIYGTLVMFDLTLTVFVLSALLCLLNYAETRCFRHIALMALCLGLGVLAKGPVAYLYVAFPILLAPFWVPSLDRRAAWYGNCLAAILLSLIPVCLWLVPVLMRSDNHFAFWLLWEQTAGRVTGNFNDAHIRPFYFYLPLVPMMFAPWLFFPAFWRRVKTVSLSQPGMAFILCWIAPVFLSFSFISGKQPHYLLPLLPGVVLVVDHLLRDASFTAIRRAAVLMLVLLIAGQGVAARAYFPKYDLRPIADYVRAHPHHPWAFVRNYHGEVGFLARLDQPVENMEITELDAWFATHPDGLAMVRYDEGDDLSRFQELYSQPYRGRMMGIFAK